MTTARGQAPRFTCGACGTVYKSVPVIQQNFRRVTGPEGYKGPRLLFMDPCLDCLTKIKAEDLTLAETLDLVEVRKRIQKLPQEPDPS